ncbi:hypothetical protein C6514_27850 [Escherichia coli]|nr:hypothetical protein [Escherichia coli]NYX28284.1 hypothetical protein [Escherichia coli]PZY37190.1 hypothetical protein DIV19_28545 [Escherichia coli]PZY37892.1 hypothetical protein DIV21_23290 [Escherichia coli]PZZ45415.1 hypothetical protein DIV20_21680 [Escherichia coli]
MLICSIIWFGNRMLRVVVLRGRFFDDIFFPLVTSYMARILHGCASYVTGQNQNSEHPAGEYSEG